MKRLFLLLTIAFALIGSHVVYADGPPGPLTQQAQAQYDGLPTDVQRQIDEQLQTTPAEDWEQLIGVTVDLYAQNTNNYTMSSGGCAVSSSVWRSYSANRIYGSTLASCGQTSSWITAFVKLTSPSGSVSYGYGQGTHTTAVMATTSQSYQSGRWHTYGVGNFPHWSGTAGNSGNF